MAAAAPRRSTARWVHGIEGAGRRWGYRRRPPEHEAHARGRARPIYGPPLETRNATGVVNESTEFAPPSHCGGAPPLGRLVEHTMGVYPSRMRSPHSTGSSVFDV